MTGPRSGEEIILIDDHVVVACAPPDASPCLASPDAIAAWFDAHRAGDRTTVRSPVGDLELYREREDWRPADGVLTIDGTAGPVRFHAYFTLRATIRPDPDDRDRRRGAQISVRRGRLSRPSAAVGSYTAPRTSGVEATKRSSRATPPASAGQRPGL